MPDGTKETGGIAAERLRSFVERIERLEAEKKDLGADIRTVYQEAKGTGFEPKIIRQVIKLRGKEIEERQEEQHLLDLYKTALGIE